MKRWLAVCLLALGAGLAIYLIVARDNAAPRLAEATPTASIEANSTPPSQANAMQAVSSDTTSFQIQRLPGRAYSLAHSIEAPAGDVVAVVEALRVRAEAGDDAAAYQIYLKLASCRQQFAEANANATRTPDADSVTYIPEECRGIPNDQWRSYTARWLEASAANGYLPAQLTYAADPESVIGKDSDMLSNPEAVAAYRRKAMDYLKRAAASGNVEALQKLALAHANGALTQRNPSMAYAYAWAANQATGSIVPPDLAERVLKKYASDLSGDEVNQASQQGRSIYEECCSP